MRERNTKWGGNFVVFRIKNGIAEAVESWGIKTNADNAAESLRKWDMEHGYRYAVEEVSDRDLNLIKRGEY